MDNNRWSISNDWEFSNKISTGDDFLFNKDLSDCDTNDIGSYLFWSHKSINGIGVKYGFEKIFERKNERKQRRHDS
jgi:hypothetical protein